MPCRPFFCDHQADCSDGHCPGHPLHQQDGGHSVNGGIAFPIGEEDDEPAVTPERAEGWASHLAVALLALASACLALSCIAFSHS